MRWLHKYIHIVLLNFRLYRSSFSCFPRWRTATNDFRSSDDVRDMRHVVATSKDGLMESVHTTTLKSVSGTRIPTAVVKPVKRIDNNMTSRHDVIVNQTNAMTTSTMHLPPFETFRAYKSTEITSISCSSGRSRRADRKLCTID